MAKKQTKDSVRTVVMVAGGVMLAGFILARFSNIGFVSSIRSGFGG